MKPADVHSICTACQTASGPVSASVCAGARTPATGRLRLSQAVLYTGVAIGSMTSMPAQALGVGFIERAPPQIDHRTASRAQADRPDARQPKLVLQAAFSPALHTALADPGAQSTPVELALARVPGSGSMKLPWPQRPGPHSPQPLLPEPFWPGTPEAAVPATTQAIRPERPPLAVQSSSLPVPRRAPLVLDAPALPYTAPRLQIETLAVDFTIDLDPSAAPDGDVAIATAALTPEDMRAEPAEAADDELARFVPDWIAPAAGPTSPAAPPMPPVAQPAGIAAAARAQGFHGALPGLEEQAFFTPRSEATRARHYLTVAEATGQLETPQLVQAVREPVRRFNPTGDLTTSPGSRAAAPEIINASTLQRAPLPELPQTVPLPAAPNPAELVSVTFAQIDSPEAPASELAGAQSPAPAPSPTPAPVPEADDLAMALDALTTRNVEQDPLQALTTAPDPEQDIAPIGTPLADEETGRVSLALKGAQSPILSYFASAGTEESAEASEGNDNASEPPESLAAAVVLALKENPDIQIAKAREDDAYFAVWEARAGYLPTVDATLGAGPERNVPFGQANTTQVRREASLTLRQNLWDFGLTLYDVRRAKTLYKSANWAVRERIEDISFEIATAYIGILERQRLTDLTRENLDAHERILKMVRTQKELGLSTGADVSRVETRLNGVKSELLDRESELDQSREQYRRLVNRLPGRVVDPPFMDSALPATADGAVGMIDTASPRLQQTLAARTSLLQQRKSHRGNFFPQIGLELQGNAKNDVQGDTNRNEDFRAMVTVKYNLFRGGADVAVKRRLDARIREIDYEVDRVRREVEQDIRNDFTAVDASRNKIGTINDEVASAQRVVALYVEQFKTGRRTAFDLLDAQQAFIAARAQQVTNGYEGVISSYRVLQKLGLLFDHIGGEAIE